MQDERTEPSVSLGGPSSEEQQLLSEDQHEQTAAESPAALAPGGKDVLRDQAGHESVTLTDLKTQEARSRTGDAAGRASSPVTSAPASPLDTPRATAADATSSSLSQASDREQQTQSSRDAAVATSFSESSSEVPVVVGNPYRRRNSKHAKPKSILKPPPPPQAKFSFRRDVLGYVVGEAAPLQSLNPINTASNLSNSQPSKSVASSADPSPTSTATAPEQSESNEIPRHRATAPASVPQPGAAPARSNTGGLWKRLGGAVTAVAGSVPVPQNAVKTLNSITSAVRSSPTLEAARSGTTGPDNAQTASGRASHYVQPRATDSLKADYVKSVRFTMSSLSVVYPINGPGPPGVEAETRKRINKEHLARQENREKKDGWTNLDLLDLYEECCRTREEPGIAPLRTLLMSTSSLPKVIDLRDIQLTHGSAAVLSDLLTIDFGLRKLILDNCGLDDESIKMIIHALLVSGTLPSLSLANNRKIRSKGWRIISYYVRRSPHLKYLDLSDNVIDKKMADLLGEAVSLSTVSSAMPARNQMRDDEGRSAHFSDEDETDPFANRRAPLLLSNTNSRSGLTSLRLENCSLRNPVLESLANSIRLSGIKHISLRRNRINQLGAVALAVLIRDYELSASEQVGSNAFKLAQNPGGAEDSIAGTPTFPVTSHSIGAGASYRNGHLDSKVPASDPFVRHSEHLDQQPSALRAATPDLTGICSPSSSSSTSVAEIEDHETSFGPDRNEGRVTVSAREASRYAEMRSRLQKQIEVLPRVGTLLTLDIRTNDIKGGVTYISQVLKRNRTLRVLNLSDNKIEPAGLVALSEALKYNTTLETLDLSNNPCCGPALEGIRALRTALVLNESLMRIFLNATAFESTGAIALAEYLPDMQSIIHLDLTDNPDLSIAGVMALAASVKHNRTIRCLDLSIPPNNAEFARLSQDILQSCVRNTERAQEKSAAKGTRGGIATPIYKSELARELKGYEEQSRLASEVQLPDALKTLAESARHCIDVFSTAVTRDEELRKDGQTVSSKYTVQGLRDQAIAVQLQLSETSKMTAAGPERQALEAWAAHLAILLQRATNLYGFESEITTPLRLTTTNLVNPALLSPHSPIRSPASPSQQLSSPSFSITDSDGSESDSSVEDDRDLFSSNANPDDTAGLKTLSPKADSVSPTRTPRPLSLELPHRTSPSASPRSPVENHSRSLTLEEGEVFRRGISKVGDDDERTLLDVLDGKEDIAGEELKQEILETEVDRPRRPSVSAEDAPDSELS